MPVIAALKLHNVFAFRISSRQADRRHGRFCPRTDEAHLLHVRKCRQHKLREIRLRRSGSPKTRSITSRSQDGIQHTRLRVAKNQRPPRSDVIDKLVLVREFTMTPVVPEVALSTASTTRWPLRGLERVLERTSWWEKFKTNVEIARINHTPIRLAGICVLATVAVAALVGLALGTPVISILLLPLGPVILNAAVIKAERRILRVPPPVHSKRILQQPPEYKLIRYSSFRHEFATSPR